MKAKFFTAVMLVLGSSMAAAADIPRKSVSDHRIRYVTYNSEQVVILKVRPGVVTRVVLEADEKITVAGTGLSAKCEDEGAQWCIKAEKDSNQIWIKPYPGARFNNLELSSNKRDYSFRLEVDNNAFYRIVMQYPIPEKPMPPYVRDALQGAQVAAAGSTQVVPDSAVAEKVAQRMRNTNYLLQFGLGGEDVAPTLVFDDGRYTFFRFPKAREIPAVFAVASDGQEVRVNYHMEDDVIVVQRTARKFFLRIGESVVAVINEGWDPAGVSTDSGVTDGSGNREILK